MNFNDSSTVYFLPVSLARTVFLFLLPILPVGLSLIAIQRLGALAFESLGGGGEYCCWCCRGVFGHSFDDLSAGYRRVFVVSIASTSFQGSLGLIGGVFGHSSIAVKV